ncbi:TIGR04283 family arsenosugar biosynthesis glycosyltransferase [Pseudothauera rhizosphaerae]|uniref:Glycosyltransferase n=1 Tax=Pseudothauera rhizosphaerae TaxID=2565932 RepID=A0A4S4AS58_9RHOO|nr:TIGR04283 family arsenosugar biosynthesis glycosyltransferase [Pseudothauera rhizosphaerae]THF62650.1 glycosyltransferase [Pseudothauera rhizosphaerae]
MAEPENRCSLSIILPVLDEAGCIVATLSRLQALRRQGAELIVVDGGSRDGTVGLAEPLADRVIASPRGRSLQMNAGAAIATGDVLLFLHADTSLPEEGWEAISHAVARGAVWGRFDVRIDGRPWMLRVIAAMMNWRSRLSGIATGDQAIFVRRAAFLALGGYPPMPLMEDLALSDALKAVSRPACLRSRVTTSGRRWERKGVWRTIFLMWRLRAAFRRGVSPDALARQYDT